MKNSLILGSLVLIAPTIALAQPQLSPEKAPPLLVPMAPSATPALDAFAGVGTQLQLQLQARFVQIDAATLPTVLPAWDKAGTWSHVATPDELRALGLLNLTGVASTFDVQLSATNNQIATLSFSPFTSFTLPSSDVPLPDSGPIDDMVIPREKSRFDAPPPYIPNLAKPESKLPEMAPMPGAGGNKDLPFAARKPSTRPQMSRELADLMAYRFQIRPTIIGQQIALELRSLNSANNIASTVRANSGETIVFSLPNILVLQGPYKVRRTFLLVAPRLAPQMPRDLPSQRNDLYKPSTEKFRRNRGGHLRLDGTL